MSIWEGIKRGVKGAVSPGPAKFEAGGQWIQCPHCKADRFIEGSALLATAGMAFFGAEWANKAATTLMCDKCGLIQWFGTDLKRE
jgi:hypothetical protein